VGIWIRSQDFRMLINVNGVRVYNNVLWATGIEEEIEARLGEYATEAEAVKVLNMMRENIGTTRVFQMPPAGFSQPSKEPAANMEKDLDLYKEALTIVLDSYEYVNCDNCPLREGCSRREATAICISDLRDYFLEEARESIAKAEGGGE